MIWLQTSERKQIMLKCIAYSCGKKIKASPPLGSLSRALDGVPNASMDSIRKSSRNVNSLSDQTETENFKKWFGDWQNDPAKASKVVNEDGTPKVRPVGWAFFYLCLANEPDNFVGAAYLLFPLLHGILKNNLCVCRKLCDRTVRNSVYESEDDQ